MGKLRINMRELKFRYWNPIAKTYKMSWRYNLTHDGKILAYDVDMMDYDEPTDEYAPQFSSRIFRRSCCCLFVVGHVVVISSGCASVASNANQPTLVPID